MDLELLPASSANNKKSQKHPGGLKLGRTVLLLDITRPRYGIIPPKFSKLREICLGIKPKMYKMLSLPSTRLSHKILVLCPVRVGAQILTRMLSKPTPNLENSQNKPTVHSGHGNIFMYDQVRLCYLLQDSPRKARC